MNKKNTITKMKTIYLHIPDNLLHIYIRIIQNIRDTYTITRNIDKADFMYIYPYNDNIIPYITDILSGKDTTIKYINNFYSSISQYCFYDNYIKANYFLMDYLYSNDCSCKKYLLHYISFTKNNFVFLEKIMMLENYNKKGRCKWLLFDDELHFQKIIYNYDDIYNTIKYYNYDNWQLQKMVYSPKDIVIKCYVLYINNSNGDVNSYNIHKTVYVHSSIVAIVDNEYYLADEYFEKKYTDYDKIYRQVIKIVQNTTDTFHPLFIHIRNILYTYSLLEYTFHIDGYKHKNKVYLHNIHILPTIQWPSLLYKIYYDMLEYFTWENDKKKNNNTWIKIYTNNAVIKKKHLIDTTFVGKCKNIAIISIASVFIILLLFSCLKSFII